jgi:tRNA 5-methylaminomethyl-2-thiouridine biosynthesis bifunctional protein
MSPSHAVVVGAGLAGASTAYALAERGWQVLVLDAAPSASAGASGVPAGLMSPLISEDNNPRSRLIRAGMRLTRQHAEKLLRPGLDWQASGVLEKLGQGTSSDQTERWHADGAWIKPQALIAQWLAHPLVQLQTETQVTRLLLTETQGWEVQDAAGGTVAQAPLMVLAHSLEAFEMASPWLNTKVQPIGVQGLVSWGWRQQTDWPSYPLHPVNGLGSFIPSVPYGPKAPAGNGDIWLSGATYLKQTDATPNADSQASQHLDNLRRLRTLWPSAAQLLEPQFQTSPDKPKVWSGVRAVLPHRLPFAGPLARGLWLHAGLGSRGLSLCVLGAELIACRIAGEPWPIDRDLAKHLLKPTVQA